MVSFSSRTMWERLAREWRLIYWHIVWLTAQGKIAWLSCSWEHTEDRVKGLYVPNVCEEYIDRLDKEILPFIREFKVEEILARAIWLISRSWPIRPGNYSGWAG